jgi:hypothetical protein
MEKQHVIKDNNMELDNFCRWKKEKGSSYYEILLNDKVIATIQKDTQMYKDFVSFYVKSKKSRYKHTFMVEKEGESFMVTFHSITSKEYYLGDGLDVSNYETYTNKYDMNGNLLHRGKVEEMDWGGGPWD